MVEPHGRPWCPPWSNHMVNHGQTMVEPHCRLQVHYGFLVPQPHSSAMVDQSFLGQSVKLLEIETVFRTDINEIN